MTLVAALAFAVPAFATDPAALFDAPGQNHTNVCVRLASSRAPLTYADGAATGFNVLDSFSFDNGDCPAGNVRLDFHELIPSSGGPLVFHRGGNGYVDEQNVKYGELRQADLATPLPAPTPSSGGRGAPCTLAQSEPAYSAQIHSIPGAMHYKRPQDVPRGSNSGASFMHYGDPGADQGDNPDIHYSYLLWSFVDVGSGGHVRTLLAPNEPLRACDVQPITMTSWDRAGNPNGRVTARYVRVLAGSCPLYGWMVWSHTYGTHATVAHVAASAAPPPPDPAPDPSCPVAAPASPPQVSTGSTSAAPGGGATLNGTVDPVGVTSSYHFDVGLDTAYGASTPDAGLASADRNVPVSTPLTGLQPATIYHYRLVATNTHGTTYGADATFATPASAPAAAPVTLSHLRVAPAKFKRARRRGGAGTRIRYTLSAPARVMLVFQRRSVGVRRGGRCRPAPRHGIKRGAHRCARWAPVRGSLHQTRTRAGTASARFGGWIGRRALARGRYRVAAQAKGVGPRSIVRHAGFTLR